MDIIPAVATTAVLMLVAALIIAFIALVVMEWGRKR